MIVKIITKNGKLKTYHTIEEIRDDGFLVCNLAKIDRKETAKNLEDYWTSKFQDQVNNIIFDSVVSYEIFIFDYDGDITGHIKIGGV